MTIDEVKCKNKCLKVEYSVVEPMQKFFWPAANYSVT